MSGRGRKSDWAKRREDMPLTDNEMNPEFRQWIVRIFLPDAAIRPVNRKLLKGKNKRKYALHSVQELK